MMLFGPISRSCQALTKSRRPTHHAPQYDHLSLDRELHGLLMEMGRIRKLPQK